MAVDRSEKFRNNELIISRKLLVAAGTTIYEGNLVGISAGGRAIDVDTTRPIAGIAINNRAGGNYVTCYFNHVITLSLPGVTEADISKNCYALDNTTLTLSENDAIVGKIIDIDTDKETASVHFTTIKCLNGMPAGSNTDIQFNDNNQFGGESYWQVISESDYAKKIQVSADEFAGVNKLAHIKLDNQNDVAQHYTTALTTSFWSNSLKRFEIESDGILSAQTANYESLLTSDNDIPNKKYVDDATTIGNVIMVAKSGGQYTSVQDGIDAAVAGDVVYVYPGNYTEDVTLKDDVTVKGECSRSSIIEGKVTYSGSSIAVISYIGVSAINEECVECTGSGNLRLIKVRMVGTWDTGVGQTITTAKSLIKISNGDVKISLGSYMAITTSGDNTSEHNTACYWVTDSNLATLTSFNTQHIITNTTDAKQNLEVMFCNNTNANTQVTIKNGFIEIDGVVDSNNYVAPFYNLNAGGTSLIDGNLMFLEDSGHCYTAFNFNSSTEVIFSNNVIFPVNIADKYLAFENGTGTISCNNNSWNEGSMPQISGTVTHITTLSDGGLESNGEANIGGEVNLATGRYNFEDTDPGTLVLNQPVYNSVKVPPGVLTYGGPNVPSISDWQPGGTGATYKVYAFLSSSEGFFEIQGPHDYKEGSPLLCYITWTPRNQGVTNSGNTVAWKMDLSYTNIDGTMPSSATIDLTDTCDGTNDKVQLTPGVSLSGPSQKITGVVMGRVYRDTGDTWVGATAATSPVLINAFFVHETDTIGSRQTLIK